MDHTSLRRFHDTMVGIPIPFQIDGPDFAAFAVLQLLPAPNGGHHPSGFFTFFPGYFEDSELLLRLDPNEHCFSKNDVIMACNIACTKLNDQIRNSAAGDYLLNTFIRLSHTVHTLYGDELPSTTP